jgi:hypothetical protein
VSTDFIDFLWKQSLETIFSAKKTIFNTLKHSKLTQIIEISYLTPPKNFLNGFTPISKMTKTTAIKVEMCGKFSSLIFFYVSFLQKELIREVEMGPFKHTLDDGLDIRKVIYHY